MNHFSTVTSAHLIDFFQETLGAPNPIGSGNQLWWLKEGFNLLGLIGFFAFIVPFAAMLLKIPVFRFLKSRNDHQRTGIKDRKGKAQILNYQYCQRASFVPLP